MGSDKISSFRQRKTGNFFSDYRAGGEQQLLNNSIQTSNLITDNWSLKKNRVGLDKPTRFCFNLIWFGWV